MSFLSDLKDIKDEHLMPLLATALLIAPGLEVLTLFFRDWILKLDFLKILLLSFGFSFSLALPAIIFFVIFITVSEDDSIRKTDDTTLSSLVMAGFLSNAISAITILISYFFNFNFKTFLIITLSTLYGVFVLVGGLKLIWLIVRKFKTAS